MRLVCMFALLAHGWLPVRWLCVACVGLQASWSLNLFSIDGCVLWSAPGEHTNWYCRSHMANVCCMASWLDLTVALLGSVPPLFQACFTEQ